MKMKLNPNSIPSQTSNKPDPKLKVWEHPWNKHMIAFDAEKVIKENGCTRKSDNAVLIKPNPPSQQAVERAKFVDKTYEWSGDNSVRSRSKRSDS